MKQTGNLPILAAAMAFSLGLLGASVCVAKPHAAGTAASSVAAAPAAAPAPVTASPPPAAPASPPASPSPPAATQNSPDTPPAAATAPTPTPVAVDPAPSAPPQAAADTSGETETVTNPYSLSALWDGGDFVARGTLIILAVMSLGTWYTFFTKSWEQARLNIAARGAAKNFWTTSSVREGADRLKSSSPFRYLAETGLSAREHHEGTLTESIDLHSWVTMSVQRAVDTVNNRLQGAWLSWPQSGPRRRSSACSAPSGAPITR
jgi:biopolymer transport protein ExbB